MSHHYDVTVTIMTSRSQLLSLIARLVCLSSHVVTCNSQTEQPNLQPCVDSLYSLKTLLLFSLDSMQETMTSSAVGGGGGGGGGGSGYVFSSDDRFYILFMILDLF